MIGQPKVRSVPFHFHIWMYKALGGIPLIQSSVTEPQEV